jgi:hypothetical protein
MRHETRLVQGSKHINSDMSKESKQHRIIVAELCEFMEGVALAIGYPIETYNI